MFDKNLFLSLCKEYGVELSKIYSRPMIKDDKEIREITSDDINDIFMIQSENINEFDNKIKIKPEVLSFYPSEIYILAC